jgi:hypothetical protein
MNGNVCDSVVITANPTTKNTNLQRNNLVFDKKYVIL